MTVCGVSGFAHHLGLEPLGLAGTGSTAIVGVRSGAPAIVPLPGADETVARATFDASERLSLQSWLDGALRAPGHLDEGLVPGLVRATMRILSFALPESALGSPVEVVIRWHPETMELRIGPAAALELSEPSVVLYQALAP